MKFAALALYVLCFGCSSIPSDGSFRIVWTDDPHRDCMIATGRALALGRINGCAYQENGVCTIIAKQPKGETDRERLATLGHELLHCKYGDWHTPH